MEILQCNKCSNYFEINQEVVDKIAYAKEKGLGMILFNCPKCNQQNKLAQIYTNLQ